MQLRKLFLVIINRLMPLTVREKKSLLPIIIRYNPNVDHKIILNKSRIYLSNTRIDDISDYVNQMSKCFNKQEIDISGDFVYPYDTLSYRQLRPGKQIICSNTVDFGIVISSSLTEIKQRLSKCSNRKFAKAEIKLIQSIEKLAKRIKANNIDNTIYGMPATFKEALQKLLFYHALFWQANHWHVGLGRLDLVLFPFYEHDIKNGSISRQEAKQLITEVLCLLNRDIAAKSGMLLGDSGQYILLDGINDKGEQTENDLTLLFLEIFQTYKKPDPKLILRVNQHTSDAVWNKAIDCIVTGIGSPLIMNEDLLMKGMLGFGYKNTDLWNIGTSACWEPLIIGKSFDQNNALPNIPVIKSLNDIILSGKDFSFFEDLLASVKENIAKQIAETIHDIDFDVSPLYSLFFDSCIDKGLDYTKGGADYSFHGVQIVSFPNLVNALININTFIFKRKMLSFEKCREVIHKNFVGNEDIQKMLLSNDLKFGSSDESVLFITKDLMTFISDEVKKYTINGSKIKVGFSSSQYISLKDSVNASLDGRLSGEPFAVHISPVSHKIDIQEVLNFAGSLDYSGNRMNGNVVDFILPTSFIVNKDKLILLLKKVMTKGVFELQLNVLDAKTLKDAKANPEKYPNLIVRVWGFSAYFNDLPDTYKDNLIKRAETYN